jgi:hypothetical protein
MPYTLDLSWELTDEETLLLDKLRETGKPVDAPPDWEPESREDYVEREALADLRSKIHAMRLEYRRRNLDLILRGFDTMSTAAQAEYVDRIGLQYVGLELRPLMVVVPDIAGMTQDEAIVALAAVKLAIGAVTTETSETVPVDEIISQSPAAGTTVQARSRVAIVKSLGPA